MNHVALADYVRLCIDDAPLADAGVSVFAVSTYRTDYLLVPDRDLNAALQALRTAGHTVG